MTDPPQQRAERARVAKLALDEFMAPAFDIVREEYERRLRGICASKPWATNEIAALANATRIVDEVRNQITAIIADGEVATQQLNRAKRIEELSPAKKRLLSVGPF